MAHVRMSVRPALIALAIAAASVAALLLLSSASASDDDPAQGDVRRQDGKIVRELPELRTANSRTCATSARTQVTRAYAHPVNFRSDGKWVAIDPSLEPSDAPGVALENAAAPFDVELPDSLADPSPTSPRRARSRSRSCWRVRTRAASSRSRSTRARA